MNHYASSSFWSAYQRLPDKVRRLADKNYELLKQNPAHPSLRLKRLGRYWSARIGIHYRALGVEVEDGLLWFWIGTHAEYDDLVKA